MCHTNLLSGLLLPLSKCPALLISGQRYYYRLFSSPELIVCGSGSRRTIFSYSERLGTSVSNASTPFNLLNAGRSQRC